MPLLWTAALLAAPVVQADSSDPLYVWTDGAGHVHYTSHWERIPPAQRGAARVVDVSRPAVLVPWPEEVPAQPAADGDLRASPAPAPGSSDPDAAEGWTPDVE